MLHQMTRQVDLADMPSTHKQTSDFIPSVAALDGAKALMKKEWNRNESGEEIPRQYSTFCGHLTSTQPREDYTRMDSTLNITLGGHKMNITSQLHSVGM